MSASARTTAGGGVALQFPYREALVDDLKQEVPPRFRRFDRDAKCWLILGAYAPTAIDLLLEHFPRAEVPGDAPRRAPSTPARTETPATPRPALIVPLPAAADQTPLLAVIPCPTCHTRYEQPVRVVAETSRTVAKRETTAPELVAVCPNCHTLAVVSFFPAVTPAWAA